MQEVVARRKACRRCQVSAQSHAWHSYYRECKNVWNKTIKYWNWFKNHQFTYFILFLKVNRTIWRFPKINTMLADRKIVAKRITTIGPDKLDNMPKFYFNPVGLFHSKNTLFFFFFQWKFCCFPINILFSTGKCNTIYKKKSVKSWFKVSNDLEFGWIQKIWTFECWIRFIDMDQFDCWIPWKLIFFYYSVNPKVSRTLFVRI